MHGIVLALKESNLFKDIDVIELVDEESVKLVRIKAKVINGTLLYINELHTPDYQKYAYHWQKENGELIIRWDNKPHWRDIRTFPHHMHVHEKDKALPSHRVTVSDVIEEIRKRF